MQYLYLFAAVATSGFSGIFYKKASGVSKSRIFSAVLPIMWYLPLAVIFAAAALAFGGINFSSDIVLPGLLSGAAAALCAYSLLESMKANSFSIAIIIVNLSFVFPVLLSMLFLGEKQHIIQLIGMVISVGAIVFLNTGAGKGKSSVRAIILALISSLCNGLMDFAIKIQQFNTPGEGESSFFFFTYIFAVLIAVAVYAISAIVKKKPAFSHGTLKALRFTAPGIAFCNGVCFLAVSLLAGTMNAAAEFTVITSLSIVVSLVFGWLKMKERLKIRELISLLCCAAAICCQYLNLV